MASKYTVGTSHIELDPEALGLFVKRSADKILEIAAEKKIDFIAITGMSGAAIGFSVSILTKIPIALVRKSDDDTHSWYSIDVPQSAEGHDDFREHLRNKKARKNYLILDDLIENGKTVSRVYNKVRRSMNNTSCLGIVLYNDICTHKPFKLSSKKIAPVHALNATP